MHTLFTTLLYQAIEKKNDNVIAQSINGNTVPHQNIQSSLSAVSCLNWMSVFVLWMSTASQCVVFKTNDVIKHVQLVSPLRWKELLRYISQAILTYCFRRDIVNFHKGNVFHHKDIVNKFLVDALTRVKQKVWIRNRYFSCMKRAVWNPLMSAFIFKMSGNILKNKISFHLIDEQQKFFFWFGHSSQVY